VDSQLAGESFNLIVLRGGADIQCPEEDPAAPIGLANCYSCAALSRLVIRLIAAAAGARLQYLCASDATGSTADHAWMQALSGMSVAWPTVQQSVDIHTVTDLVRSSCPD